MYGISEGDRESTHSIFLFFKLNVMRIFSIILSISALVFISCYSRGQSKQSNVEGGKQQAYATSLSVSLKPGKSYTFNIFDNYARTVYFKNITDKDTVISKRLPIDKPLYLVYGSVLMVPTGDPILRTYNLLLCPGDSVVLKEGIDGAILMESTSGFSNFIDSLISIPKDFYWHNMKQQQTELKAMGLNRMLENIDSSFQKNEASIGNLDLSETRSNILRNLNGIITYTAIAHLLLESDIADSKLTDSLHEEMFRHIEEIRSITLNNLTICKALIAYNARKGNRNLDKNDFWGCVTGADEQLKQTDLYKQYLICHVGHTFVHEPKNMAELNKKLLTIRGKDPFLDTLYQVTNILSKTFTNFAQARTDLRTFAGGRFNFLLENDQESSNHETKNISGLPPVSLSDFRGNKSDFMRIIRRKNYKLTVVDFWASWCIPCIGEIPHLKKMENKFKSKPIQFVTISIDKEEDIQKWVAAAKKNGIYNEPNQYRLANFKKSPLTKMLNIRNIPRYLVINNKGEIVDANFSRPSDSSFELELLKYLN